MTMRQVSYDTTLTQAHELIDGTTITALEVQGELLERVKAYAAGERPGTIMPRLARGFTTTEMAHIAAWFATRSASAEQ